MGTAGLHICLTLTLVGAHTAEGLGCSPHSNRWAGCATGGGAPSPEAAGAHPKPRARGSLGSTPGCPSSLPCPLCSWGEETPRPWEPRREFCRAGGLGDPDKHSACPQDSEGGPGTPLVGGGQPERGVPDTPQQRQSRARPPSRLASRLGRTWSSLTFGGPFGRRRAPGVPSNGPAARHRLTRGQTVRTGRRPRPRTPHRPRADGQGPGAFPLRDPQPRQVSLAQKWPHLGRPSLSRPPSSCVQTSESVGSSGRGSGQLSPAEGGGAPPVASVPRARCPETPSKAFSLRGPPSPERCAFSPGENYCYLQVI